MYFREHQMSKRISLVAEALPIIDKIGQLQKDGKIEPEQAAILRRDVIDASKKYLSCGATIPEMHMHSTFKPNELLSPQPKLISQGQEDLTNKSNDLPQKFDSGENNDLDFTDQIDDTK